MQLILEQSLFLKGSLKFCFQVQSLDCSKDWWLTGLEEKAFNDLFWCGHSYTKNNQGQLTAEGRISRWLSFLRVILSSSSSTSGGSPTPDFNTGRVAVATEHLRGTQSTPELIRIFWGQLIFWTRQTAQSDVVNADELNSSKRLHSSSCHCFLFKYLWDAAWIPEEQPPFHHIYAP